MKRSEPTSPLLTLMAVIILTTASAFASWLPDLELKIMCDKNMYLLDEPIWIDILLTNHDSDTVTVQFPTPELGRDIFRFVVVGEEHDTIPYTGLAFDFVQEGIPNVRIAPGDTVYNVYNLLKGYERSPGFAHNGTPSIQGLVEVTAQFWTSCRSNTLHFEIVHPQGFEQEAHKLLVSTVRRKADSTTIRHLEDIVDRYGGSVYAERALYGLAVSYDVGIKNPDLEYRFGLTLFQRFPNSGYMLYCLPYYLHAGKSIDRAIVLDSLMTSDKPFRLRMIARNYQRKLPVY